MSVCQVCNGPTDNRPAVCNACGAEREHHRRTKAHHRWVTLTRRTTTAANPKEPTT